MERDSSSQKGLDLESRQKEKVKDKEWLKVLPVWVCVWQRKKIEREKERNSLERERNRSKKHKKKENMKLKPASSSAAECKLLHCQDEHTNRRMNAKLLHCTLRVYTLLHQQLFGTVLQKHRAVAAVWIHGTEEGSVTWVGAVDKHTTDRLTNHPAGLTSCPWMTRSQNITILRLLFFILESSGASLYDQLKNTLDISRKQHI